MYRLLSFSPISLRLYPKLSYQNASNKVESEMCHLCKQLNNISEGHFRNQSTVTNPNPNQKKVRKKRTKSLKKYAELLIVSENSSTQKKAHVQKLTFSDLKLLANSNLNLSELYKLKQLTKDVPVTEHSYSNLTIVENLPYSSDSLHSKKNEVEPEIKWNIPVIEPLSKNENAEYDILKDNLLGKINPQILTKIERELELETLKVVNTLQPEELEETVEHVEPEEVKDPKTKSKMSQAYREEVISKTLGAFIEICCILKNPYRGLNALQFHRNKVNRVDKLFLPIKDVNVYNALLKGFASKGDLEKMQEVLRFMEDDGLQFNVQTYVAIFDCLGRTLDQERVLKDIRIFAKKAINSGFTFDEIMNKGCFLNDEREVVLDVMKRYNPNYEPTFYPPKIYYKNHLVNGLNLEEQLEPSKEEFVEENKGLFTPELLKSKIQQQLELEKNGYITIKSIEPKEEPTKEVLFYRKQVEAHYKLWEEAATEAFNRDLMALSAQRNPINYEPFMRSIPVKDFVTIIVEEAKRLAQGSETYSPTVSMLYKDLGNKAYARYKVLRKQKTGVLDKTSQIHEKYCDYYAAQHKKLNVLPDGEVIHNPRHNWQWAHNGLIQSGVTLNMDQRSWVPTVLTSIGKFLYHIIMHDIKIDVNSMRMNSQHKNYLPAFYTIFRTQGRTVKEEVKPHPVLTKLYRGSMPETLSFPASEVPMLCPPVPWTSPYVGGYLVAPCEVVRLPIQAGAQKQLLAKAEPEQLYPSLDALNQLASVPWKVNQKILDVILQVFKSGGSSKLDVPEPASSLEPPKPTSLEMNKTEKYNLFRQRLQYRRKKAEMHSLWCDCLYRLSLAEHFRNDVFWLPHNMDFRGRVYPIPPHLNHLGSDLARSMLIFAESRPLGPNGLDWLKIHLINLTGLKKRDPVSERLKYANEIMDLILDSADNPLNGKRWWVDSDEPWQTLACCMEIADATRSPDVENYRSHFPVHQDGSCNGLQHYAALGRDSAGAFSVNLTASDTPQDVYSAVVVLVEEQRKKDAENGLEIAKLLEGFVKRKVIKQTIMTTVYGVTRFGARLQIAKQLKDIDDFPKEQVWAASSYLTGRTFDSLRTMFTSTKEIQDWFTECARLISAVGGQQVEWVTPLGLPIVQPYFRSKTHSSNNVYEAYPVDKFEKPNVMKQKNAFPPNFVHSLDSSHMMLTSLHCERAGITFVSVHDCYWTHPSTVHIMNKICREQFVALHSEPILEDLSMFLSEKNSYDDAELPNDGSVGDLTKKKLNRALRKLPKTGDFDIMQVLDSVYFFS